MYEWVFHFDHDDWTHVDQHIVLLISESIHTNANGRQSWFAFCTRIVAYEYRASVADVKYRSLQEPSLMARSIYAQNTMFATLIF